MPWDYHEVYAENSRRCSLLRRTVMPIPSETAPSVSREGVKIIRFCLKNILHSREETLAPSVRGVENGMGTTDYEIGEAPMARFYPDVRARKLIVWVCC